MSDPRVAVAEQFFSRFFAGDVAAASDLLDPHVVYVVPGRNPAAGEFRGVQAVSGHLATFLRLTDDPIDLLKWEDWMARVDNVSGLAKIHLQREGELHDFRVIYLVSTTEDGGSPRIARIEAFYNDQEAIDRFLSIPSG